MLIDFGLGILIGLGGVLGLFGAFLIIGFAAWIARGSH